MLTGIEGFKFDDPTDMLLFVDEKLLGGKDDLHGWQLKVHQDFAKENTDKNPYQAVLRTCNGAGKDKIIIAPCATWLGMRYPFSTSVVTSASGTQLDRQTNAYIKQICEATNAAFGREIWKINYRHYENLETKSTIELFVTDESGRAEGWHPVVSGGHLGIFTSEAKTIPNEIFHALARCTGFTKRLDCSTPGPPMGHFFDRCTSGNWTKYHITAYDCPHLSREYIEQCRIDYGGENSSLFKSMVLAEFGTTDEMVVIPYHYVWNAIFRQRINHITESFNTGGLDLSAGGDETVLVVRNGNKVINVFAWKYDDTAKTIDHIEKLFKENGLQHPQALVFGDAGGLGKPILDQLRQRGWHNVRYVLNQSNPRNPRAYYNRGAELWFDFRNHLEAGEILLPNDERLRNQLSSRYYKQTESNKIQLESKLQARAKGHPSPDRADALVLAFSNYRSKLTVDENAEKKEPPIPARPVESAETAQPFTLKEHAKRQNESNDEFKRYYGGSATSKNIDRDFLRQQIEEFNQQRKVIVK